MDSKRYFEDGFNSYEDYKAYVDKLTGEKRAEFYEEQKRMQYRKLLATFEQSLAYWRNQIEGYTENHEHYWFCKGYIRKRSAQIWKYRRVIYGSMKKA